MAPRLRKDLVATTVDEEGIGFVEVTDPLTTTNFRFYDFEFALAQQLTGQPLAEVVAWASYTYDVELTTESLADFIEKLAGLGFLVGSGSGAQPAVVAPASQSSGSQAFDSLPTTIGADLPPVAASSDGGEMSAARLDTPADSPPAKGEPLTSGEGEQKVDGPSALSRDLQEALPHDVLPRLEVLSAPLPPPPPPPPVSPSVSEESHAPEKTKSAAEPFQTTETEVVAADHPVKGDQAFGEGRPSTVSEHAGAADTAETAEKETPQAPALIDWPAHRQVPTALEAEGAQPDVGNSNVPSSVEAPTAPGLPALRKAEAARLIETASEPPAQAASPAAGTASQALQSKTPTPSPLAPAAPAKPPMTWQADTPLASIAHFIVAEAGGQAPLGALDAGVISTRGTPPSGNILRPSVAPSPPRAKDIPQQVEESREERRQPPRPDVVVMPPVADGGAGEIPAPRRRLSLIVVLLVLGAIAGGAAWFIRSGRAPSVLGPSAHPVHVVSPQPTTFYRWFETVGLVVPGRDDTLGFSTAGRLQDTMPPGTTFSAGETIARLQGVSARELVVNQTKSRIAFYEQLRDSRRAEGAENAARQAETKLAARKQELAAAQASLAELEIHPKAAGEIAEVLAMKGTLVKAGAPVFRIRATGPRATFKLPEADAARARALGFCRVETIAGTGGGGADGGAVESNTRAVDCSLSTTAGEDAAQVAVDLVGSATLPAGTQVRLASARYDGVFPVPRSALVQEDGVNRLWVASTGPNGTTADGRVVDVAATIDDLALVSRGIAVGDAVIVDPSGNLRGGSEVIVAR